MNAAARKSATRFGRSGPLAVLFLVGATSALFAQNDGLARFDADADGVLSRAEIVAVHGALGLEGEAPAFAAKVLERFDTDESGSLSEAEFERLAAARRNRRRVAERQEQEAERGKAPLAPSHRNVRYLKGGSPRLNALDIYAPGEAEGLPVVVYVHGGGWSKGDKARVGSKAKLFTGEGYVFVSVNYRLSPKVQHPVHVQDVAAALAWVHGNISEYGGDPKRIGIIGHSAGAHLVALVATDESRLGAHGLDLSVIKGVVPIDIGVYDMAQLGRRDSSGRWSSVFGTDPAGLKDASPLFHVEAGKAVPDFLILVAGSPEKQPGKTQQTQAMVDALTEAKISAKVVAAPAKNHGQINQQIGLVDDAVTRATTRFFAKHLAAPAKEDELR